MLDYKRAICTHKVNNMIALEKLNNGEVRCTGCGSEFWLFDLNTPMEQIEKVCKNMHDLLQSIKAYFLNVPDSMKEIYMIIGFIPKIPLLWETAKKTFETASNTTIFNTMQNNYDANSWSVLGSIFGQSPMAPGAMWGAQQPTMVPPMGAYNTSNMGVPQTSQYGNPYVYGAQPQPTAPTAPVAPPPGYVNQTGVYAAATPAAPPMYATQGPGMVVQGPMTSPNPIGTVVAPAAPQTQGQVAINITDPTVAPAPVTVDAPVAPVNPNVQAPTAPDQTVANVAKTFTPAA